MDLLYHYVLQRYCRGPIDIDGAESLAAGLATVRLEHGHPLDKTIPTTLQSYMKLFDLPL